MTKIRIEEAVRLMISKELEKYGVDYNYVMEHQQIEDIPWYSYYKFDSKEECLKVIGLLRERALLPIFEGNRNS